MDEEERLILIYEMRKDAINRFQNQEIYIKNSTYIDYAIKTKEFVIGREYDLVKEKMEKNEPITKNKEFLIKLSSK